MIERQAESASSYSRLRTFLESEDTRERRLTAEWLAGRLHMPLRDCAAAIDKLVGEGALKRHRGGPDEAPWFELLPPPPVRPVHHAMLGAMTIGASVAIVVLGAMLHHIFFFVLGLGLGLLIAFAWLDWELRSRS